MDETVRFLQKKLFRFYIQLIAPAAGLAVAIWLLRQSGLAPSPDWAKTIAGPAVFIGAVCFAVAFPLWHRYRFVAQVKDQAAVDPLTLLAFEKTQTILVLVTPYIALAGYLLDVALFHFGGAFLAALYGIYYYFPSQARISKEVSLFRSWKAAGSPE
jgi:hypothetical protein